MTMEDMGTANRIAIDTFARHNVDSLQDLTTSWLKSLLVKVERAMNTAPLAEFSGLDDLRESVAAEIRRREEASAQQDRADGLALAAAALAEGTADGELMAAAAADCIDAALVLTLDWHERQALRKVRAALAECNAGAGLPLGA